MGLKKDFLLSRFISQWCHSLNQNACPWTISKFIGSANISGWTHEKVLPAVLRILVFTLNRHIPELIEYTYSGPWGLGLRTPFKIPRQKCCQKENQVGKLWKGRCLKKKKSFQVSSWLRTSASVWPGFDGCQLDSRYRGLASLVRLLTENMT